MYKQLLEIQNAEKQPARIIVATAGGDGTPMRVVKSASDYGINLNLIEFCFLPFGTGNDISRVTGWGGLPE